MIQLLQMGLDGMNPPGRALLCPSLAQLHTALFELTMESLSWSAVSRSLDSPSTHGWPSLPNVGFPVSTVVARNKLVGRVARASCTGMHRPTSENVTLPGDRQEITARLI